MNLEHLKRKKSLKNTGFEETGNLQNRVLGKNGKANLIKSGLPFYKLHSAYHTLLNMPRWKFLSTLFLLYISLNLFFAFIYYILGIEGIGGNPALSFHEQFLDAFFFSSQTITTLGYGRLNPVNFSSGLVASIEAFTGLLLFAIVTGLVFGRFANPRAYIIFSKNALIAPYKGGKALMFRMASYKYNTLTDLECEAIVSIAGKKDGNIINHYYNIKLEVPKVNFLALNWTLVHVIDEDSPLYGMTEQDMQNNNLEIIVFTKAFDEDFSNIVKERQSYLYSEIIYGAKFDMMYRHSSGGNKTILELDKIDSYTKVNFE